MLRQLGSSTGSASAANSAIAALVAPPIIDSNYATLELALAAVPSGGVLEVRTAWSRATSWTVNKPCTVRFVGSGQITVTGDANTHGIIITSSNVRIVKPVIVGPGITFGTAMGIRQASLAASPLDNIAISGGEVSGFARSGIAFENVTRVLVEDVHVHDIGYVGIELMSVVGATIRHNRVINITMPSGFTNAYGIGMGRDYSINANPQAQDITVENNYVRGVPTWEGIDTHAGINIRIVNNQVYDCTDHIVVIGGKNSSGVNTYAPRNVVVSGNHCDSLVTDGSRGGGVYVNGVAGSGGTSLDPATGIVVSDNTIVGCSNDSVGDNYGAISFKDTKGIVVSGNAITSPAGKGINCYDTNIGAVITDNTVVDVWLNAADNGTTAAFTVRGTWNTPYFSGNAVVRGSKTATLVNHRGMYISANSSQPVRLGQNNLDTCTTPVADSSNLTTFQSRAKNAGWRGTTAIPLPTANTVDPLTLLASQGLLPAGTTALGTAANSAASSFATSAQGAKADTAVQPADLTGSATYTPATATWHMLFPGATATGVTWTLGYLHLYPFIAPADMTLDSLMFETVTAATAGGTARFAFYGHLNGFPNMSNLLKDCGSILTDDAIGTHTLSFSYTLPKGLTYLGIVHQTAAPTMRVCSPYSPGFVLPQLSTPVTNQAQYGFVRTGVTGALPTSGALSLYTNDVPPRVYLHTA